jgi:hypothetical protein
MSLVLKESFFTIWLKEPMEAPGQALALRLPIAGGFTFACEGATWPCNRKPYAN